MFQSADDAGDSRFNNNKRKGTSTINIEEIKKRNVQILSRLRGNSNKSLSTSSSSQNNSITFNDQNCSKPDIKCEPIFTSCGTAYDTFANTETEDDRINEINRLKAENESLKESSSQLLSEKNDLENKLTDIQDTYEKELNKINIQIQELQNQLEEKHQEVVTLADMNEDLIQELQKSCIEDSSPKNSDAEMITNLANICSMEFAATGVNFMADRQDLPVLLQNSIDGRLVIAFYQTHSTLSDAMMGLLTKIIIDQELFLLLKKGNASLANPLKKVEIPGTLLQYYADQVKNMFQLRQAIFYAPGAYDKDKRSGPGGKFISRINYSRKLLSDAGLYVNRKPETNNHSISNDYPESDIDNQEGLLEVLKQSDYASNWETVTATWQQTYHIRNQKSKDKDAGNVWQFTDFPCLADERAPELIRSDFCRKFPYNKINIKDTWTTVCSSLELLIASKHIVAPEVEHYLQRLPNLSNDDKDAVMLMLLPYVFLKSTWGSASHKQPKRRKVDSTEIIKSRKQEIETFVLHLEGDISLKGATAKKDELCKQNNGVAKPYMIFIWTELLPSSYYTIMGQISYKCATPLEALELALKLYLTNNFAYPKATVSTWVLLQKTCLKINLRGQKCPLGLHEVLSFIEEKLGISID